MSLIKEPRHPDYGKVLPNGDQYESAYHDRRFIVIGSTTIPASRFVLKEHLLFVVLFEDDVFREPVAFMVYPSTMTYLDLIKDPGNHQKRLFSMSLNPSGTKVIITDHGESI